MSQNFITDFPGTRSDWNGYARYDFKLDGVDCILVKPNVPEAAGRPWYHRARFFGAFPFADLALLERGWCVTSTDVVELYGSPEAVRRLNRFYDFMVSKGYHKGAVIAGYSRGGLITYNWAEKYPEKVACLYLDNAVCDFKSWPGGQGKVRRYEDEWQRCMKAYGFASEQEALDYKDNPLDHLDVIAKAKIPVLHVTAMKDTVVTAGENGEIAVKRLKELGGMVEVIRKPEADHHPHCLENPQPIVDFIERYRDFSVKNK